jgi:hypothetical protein
VQDDPARHAGNGYSKASAAWHAYSGWSHAARWSGSIATVARKKVRDPAPGTQIAYVIPP